MTDSTKRLKQIENGSKTDLQFFQELHKIFCNFYKGYDSKHVSTM